MAVGKERLNSGMRMDGTRIGHSNSNFRGRVACARRYGASALILVVTAKSPSKYYSNVPWSIGYEE